MEDIFKESENILAKIEQTRSFISLHLRRDQIEPQLQELAKKTEDVQNLIQECNHVMKEEYDNVVQEHKLLMQKMQQQHLNFINILTERKESSIKYQTCSMQEVVNGDKTPKGILKERHPKSTEKSLLNVPSMQKFATGEKKMFIGEYLQSPFVRKTRPVPVPFRFLDFEVNITAEMFETIPKYMKGRETLEELANFLDTVLVPCFNEKYQLLHRHRDCIRNSADLDMWKVYKEQVSYFPGQNFITQGDISRKIKKMLDKKSQNKITMLRHLGILQEQRKAQTVCYIWTANV